MTKTVNSMQAVLIFSTSFDRNEALEYARKFIAASKGTFKENGVELKTDFPSYISGPAWLTLNSPGTGYAIQLSDDKLTVIWSKISKEDTKAPAEILEFAGLFVKRNLIDKTTVKRLGFVEQSIIEAPPATLRDNALLKEVAVQVDDYQLGLIKKIKVNLAGESVECNIRVDLARANYRSRDETSSKQGVLFQIDTNTIEETDIDIAIADAVKSLALLANIGAHNELISALELE